jgi:hypothetical protein
MVGLLLGLALILPACGDERTAAAGEERVTTSRQASAAKQCGRLLGGFLDSIESLTNIVAVGLDYDSYLGAVNHVRSTYADLPADRLPLVCLVRVGTPAENALNAYIDAANTWGDCLATTSCDLESVEPDLQREWQQASNFLSSAQRGLRGLG